MRLEENRPEEKDIQPDLEKFTKRFQKILSIMIYIGLIIYIATRQMDSQSKYVFLAALVIGLIMTIAELWWDPYKWIKEKLKDFTKF